MVVPERKAWVLLGASVEYVGLPNKCEKGEREVFNMRDLCGDNEEPSSIPSSPRLHSHQEGPVCSSSQGHSAPQETALCRIGPTEAPSGTKRCGSTWTGTESDPDPELCSRLWLGASHPLSATLNVARGHAGGGWSRDGPGS